MKIKAWLPILGFLFIAYAIGLIIFHNGYEYTHYWIDESVIIISSLIIFLVINLLVYFLLRRKVINLSARSYDLNDLKKIDKSAFVYLGITILVMAGMYLAIYNEAMENKKAKQFLDNYANGIFSNSHDYFIGNESQNWELIHDDIKQTNFLLIINTVELMLLLIGGGWYIVKRKDNK